MKMIMTLVTAMGLTACNSASALNCAEPKVLTEMKVSYTNVMMRKTYTKAFRYGFANSSGGYNAYLLALPRIKEEMDKKEAESIETAMKEFQEKTPPEMIQRYVAIVDTITRPLSDRQLDCTATLRVNRDDTGTQPEGAEGELHYVISLTDEGKLTWKAKWPDLPVWDHLLAEVIAKRKRPSE